MSEPPPDPSSVAELWRVLNATGAAPHPEECVGRFCTHAGVLENQNECAGDGLDTEIYSRARTNFGALSLAMTCAVLTGFCATHLLPGPTPPLSVTIRQVVLLLLSAAMFGLTRHRTLCPRTVARFGQAYQVGGAAIIALSAFGAGLPAPGLGGSPSLPPIAAWLAVWIVVFPLVAPARPWQTVGLALACASTVPAILLGAPLWGGAAAPLEAVALTATLFYAAAGVALVPSLLLQGLSRGISAARSQLSSLQTYQLFEQLGQGGMGEVWRAEHRLLKRPAAIKIVRPQRLEGATLQEREEVLSRFEREATTTASLRSPHTVDLYDFGRTDRGDFFYVMELLEGVDLEGLVDAHGPLPPERVVYLLEQACASLAEAHARGLVHRDLKPANLMVCRLGLEVDFIKVLDFGLVATAEPVRGTPKLTGDDSILGTPAYMSPEQGRGEAADSRSDVYALGCVAYWLLTGKTVFTQEKPIPMILDHVSTPPPPPSTRTTQPIPPDLERLVLDCLAKDPADRPPSARSLARLLRGLSLPQPWTQERAEGWWREHRPGAGERAAAETVTHAPGLDPRAASTLLAGQGARV